MTIHHYELPRPPALAAPHPRYMQVGLSGSASGRTPGGTAVPDSAGGFP